jgi:hypothetical protein
VHEFFKTKIESGHLAKNEKGEQGLQFRRGTAVDTDNHAFEYDMRFKALGSMGKGNSRAYAKPHHKIHKSIDNVLHEFKAISLRSH